MRNYNYENVNFTLLYCQCKMNLCVNKVLNKIDSLPENSKIAAYMGLGIGFIISLFVIAKLDLIFLKWALQFLKTELGL